MATDRSMPSPDLAMSSSTNDSPYTTKLQTALRNANPALADTLLQALNPPRKQSHTRSMHTRMGLLKHRYPLRSLLHAQLQQQVLHCCANPAASAESSQHGNDRHEREHYRRHSGGTHRLSGARPAAAARAWPERVSDIQAAATFKHYYYYY